jgi:hypothetical protein
MRKAWMRTVWAMFASVLLAGCQTSGEGQSPSASGPALPANYRQIVIESVRKTFLDPGSIRDATISAPIPGTPVMGPVTTVCVRAKAKNKMGAYTGATTTAFIFRAGQLSSTETQNIAALCAGAPYEPFPEIDSASQAARR